jgi:hypothetical protein
MCGNPFFFARSAALALLFLIFQFTTVGFANKHVRIVKLADGKKINGKPFLVLYDDGNEIELNDFRKDCKTPWNDDYNKINLL